MATPIQHLDQDDVHASRATGARGPRASESGERAAERRPSTGLGLVSVDGSWMSVSPALCGMLGYDEGELLERRAQDVTHPEDVQADVEAARRLLRGQASHCEREKRIVRKDGSEARVHQRLSLSRDNLGRPMHFVVQVTELEAVAEDEGPRAAPTSESPRASSREGDRLVSLGRLAAGVAHEINNPLTYLSGNIEFVRRCLRSLADESRAVGGSWENGELAERLDGLDEALAKAADGADRVARIVRDLKTFSRADDERRGVIDVRAVLESVIEMAWHQIRLRARLVRQLDEVPCVEASEVHLGQVFLNLLMNAVEAIPEGESDRHEIRVRTRLDDEGRVAIEFSDTGAGIAPDLLTEVFDPFFTTKPAGSAAGLGLSTCHGTVTALGGEITAESQVGHGSTFRVHLPPAARARAAHRDERAAGAPRRRGRVLVVDDEPHVGDALAKLYRAEHDVRAVASAVEALALLRQGERFDVIVCDLLMPGMSGMDLYEQLVRVAPEQAGRMVFITGGAFTPRSAAFAEHIADRCLEKPINLDRLDELLLERIGKA